MKNLSKSEQILCRGLVEILTGEDRPSIVAARTLIAAEEARWQKVETKQPQPLTTKKKPGPKPKVKPTSAMAAGG